QRLERVAQDRVLVGAAGRGLAAAQEDELPQAQLAGDGREGALRHGRRADLRELTLGEVGVVAVEAVGDDNAEHRVPEELEALVGRQPAVLVGEGTVRERKNEQVGVEIDSEPARQCLSRRWSTRLLNRHAVADQAPCSVRSASTYWRPL